MTRSAAAQASLADQDSRGLTFLAEMYGAQLDQVAALHGLTSRPARALVARWTSRSLAETAVLSPGPPWVWMTRRGLLACGVRYTAAPPALPRLAHIRATVAVRLAMEATQAFSAGGAHWRSERRLRSRLGGRLGARDHVPDAEVHWPDAGPADWAGECWAIEVELTAKTVSRTAAIMREVLGRTADYGSPAAEAWLPGESRRYARAIYLCSVAARRTVLQARDELGSLAARIEIRDLPASAYLPSGRKTDDQQTAVSRAAGASA